jgi:hypothetical protein
VGIDDHPGAHAIDALYLLIIPTVFLYIAMSAWGVTMIGLIRQVARR